MVDRPSDTDVIKDALLRAAETFGYEVHEGNHAQDALELWLEDLDVVYRALAALERIRQQLNSAVSE